MTVILAAHLASHFAGFMRGAKLAMCCVPLRCWVPWAIVLKWRDLCRERRFVVPQMDKFISGDVLHMLMVK
jgi:hypothetical protein